MNKLFRTISLIAAAVLFCCSFSACNIIGNTGDPDKDLDPIEKEDWEALGYTKLTIDGGGQDLGYNTTASMIYDKYTNPHPYNTLERLVEDWNKANAVKFGYYFTVASSSINNDRETMLPMLNAGTAPELIFYLPVTIAEDQNKGWFYNLADVMETPNKYSKEGEAGSVRWRDMYSDDVYASLFAPNGQLFNVGMELDPIGIIYNKTLFAQAGITQEPETYKEFMEAQDKLHAYAQENDRADADRDDTYLCPFFSFYPWYDSYIETSLFSDIMEDLDVVKQDNYVKSEEFVRGFMTKKGDGTRIYAPDSDRMYEVYRLIYQTCKYYPTSWTSYNAIEQFAAGNLAMCEASGANMRKILDTVDGKFEVGVFSFPVVETQPADQPKSDYYTTYNVNNYFVRRGLRGDSTSWAITNSAMNKDAAAGNDNCVNACIDMLMYLTSAEINDQMVNDLGFAVPLSGNGAYEFFTPLIEDYKSDLSNEKALAWAAVTAGSSMNKDYYDAWYLFRRSIVSTYVTGDGDIANMRNMLKTLEEAFVTNAQILYDANGWANSDWPPYAGES